MRDTERGRNTGRGRSRLRVGSSMWDWIPGVPRSRPESKADTQPPPNLPGVPDPIVFNVKIFISLVRLISKHFILFYAVVNGIVFLLFQIVCC